MQHYRQQWSFVHPLVLSGRKVKQKKRKIEASSEDAKAGNDARREARRETSSGTADSTAAGDGVSAVSKMDDAKARYLKRKLAKAGK